MPGTTQSVGSSKPVDRTQVDKVVDRTQAKSAKGAGCPADKFEEAPKSKVQSLIEFYNGGAKDASVRSQTQQATAVQDNREKFNQTLKTWQERDSRSKD